MLTEIYTTVTKPFREPLNMAEIALWVLIYAIIAFALYDMLRILAAWMEQAVG